MSYGCPYEVFWHLNPRKLEPFRKKREIEAKQLYDDLDFLAWRIGYYDTHAMGVWWGKNATSPDKPSGRIEDDAKFAAFAAAHRRTIAERRKKAETTGIG